MANGATFYKLERNTCTASWILGWARWRKIYTIPSLQLRIDLEAVQGEENLGNVYCMKVWSTIPLRRNDEVTRLSSGSLHKLSRQSNKQFSTLNTTAISWKNMIQWRVRVTETPANDCFCLDLSNPNRLPVWMGETFLILSGITWISTRCWKSSNVSPRITLKAKGPLAKLVRWLE